MISRIAYDEPGLYIYKWTVSSREYEDTLVTQLHVEDVISSFNILTKSFLPTNTPLQFGLSPHKGEQSVVNEIVDANFVEER